MYVVSSLPHQYPFIRIFVEPCKHVHPSSVSDGAIRTSLTFPMQLACLWLSVLFTFHSPDGDSLSHES